MTSFTAALAAIFAGFEAKRSLRECKEARKDTAEPDPKGTPLRQWHRAQGVSARSRTAGVKPAARQFLVASERSLRRGKNARKNTAHPKQLSSGTQAGACSARRLPLRKAAGRVTGGSRTQLVSIGSDLSWPRWPSVSPGSP